MKTIILIRHGESETNVIKAFAGQLDVPLTPNGQEQAHLMAVYMDKYNVEKIYASPLQRAQHTAQAIGNRQGCPIEPISALMEINSGQWQGKTYAQISNDYPDMYKAWKENLCNAAPEGGETCRQLYDRVIAFFKKVLAGPETVVCLVCHATPIRMIESYIEAGCMDVAQSIPWVPNASVTAYEYDGSFRTLERGTADFMGDLVSKLPSTI